ncbi:MAG TPA: hypothetical protein VNH15_08400 [Elusimicrobiota bacterium]|nr:hypothetical protein [Elusimicrobiota bacterium]
MKVPARLAAALLLAVLVCSRASAAFWPPETAGLVQSARHRLEISSARRPIGNFGEIEPGVFRGAQPSGAAAYLFLKEAGVSVVVDLRYLHKDDQTLCRRYGLSCARFPIMLFPGQDEFFNWTELKRAFFFVLAERRAGRVVFIHCRDGADRTGVLAAALVIRASHLSPAELWSHIWLTMRGYGFHDVYRSLKRRVQNWVFHPSRYPWICTGRP